jgi:hypothetical protein
VHTPHGEACAGSCQQEHACAASLDHCRKKPHPHCEPEPIFVRFAQLPAQLLHAYARMSPVSGPQCQFVPLLIGFPEITPEVLDADPRSSSFM